MVFSARIKSNSHKATYKAYVEYFYPSNGNQSPIRIPDVGKSLPLCGSFTKFLSSTTRNFYTSCCVVFMGAQSKWKPYMDICKIPQPLPSHSFIEGFLQMDFFKCRFNYVRQMWCTSHFYQTCFKFKYTEIQIFGEIVAI